MPIQTLARLDYESTAQMAPMASNKKAASPKNTSPKTAIQTLHSGVHPNDKAMLEQVSLWIIASRLIRWMDRVDSLLQYCDGT